MSAIACTSAELHVLLLQAGEWEHAERLMAWLAALDVAPAAHPPVAAALAADAQALLAPLLAAAYPQGLAGRYALDPKVGSGDSSLSGVGQPADSCSAGLLA